MNVRSGEESNSWFRSDRMLHVNENWYFVTRENTQEGPFSSRNEAENELMLYIRHTNDALYDKVGNA
jgi:Domain of unknown function (DUF6316)